MGIRGIALFLLCFFVVSCSGGSDSSSEAVVEETSVLSFGGLSSEDSASGLTIKNTSGSSVNVTGIYLTSLDIADPLNPHPCFGSIVAGANAFGALWAPVDVPAGGVVEIGKNYLYNSMLAFLYQTTQVVGSVPVTTPGAPFPASDPPLWCTRLGLTKSAPLPQVSAIPLLDTLIVHNFSDEAEEILISCDDTQQSCTTTIPSEQSFPR